MSCSIARTATSPAAATARIKSTVAAVSDAVMPAVGSSSSSRRGCVASTMPISSHWRWPWDSSRARVARWADRPMRSRSAREGAPPPRDAHWPSERLSRTDRSSNTVGTWNLRPMPSAAMRWAAQPVMSRPANVMRPASGRKAPVIRSNSVVLPQPLGPTSAPNSPSSRESETPSTARTPPKSRETSCRARRGIGVAGGSLDGRKP